MLIYISIPSASHPSPLGNLLPGSLPAIPVACILDRVSACWA